MKSGKQVLSIMLALLMLVLAVPFAAAQDVSVVASGTCGGNLTWSLNSAGVLTISGTGSMSGYALERVTGEDGAVFERTKAPWAQHDTVLTSVTIDSGVTSIGRYAFSGCRALEGATIPDSVTSIGYEAFYNCPALKSITIPNSITSIGNSAFCFCTALESVTIPDTVTSIGYNAFNGCLALESVVLPDDITSIGDSAFGNGNWYTLALCKKNTATAATLAAMSIPYAFLDGTDEESLISESVNASLSFTVDKRTRTMTVQADGDMMSFASVNAPWLEYAAIISRVVILPGCTSVGDSAFKNCYNFKSVTLPDGVRSIGNSAFSNCWNLAQINLPNGVETIDSSAFSQCYSLPSITLPDSVTSIGEAAFYSCQSLESILIPDSVTSIGSSAFYGCAFLKTAVIGEGLVEIPPYAFYGCFSLKTVSIGDVVSTVGQAAFSGCTALETVSIGENVTAIYQGAFSGCSSLQTVILPEKLTTLKSGAFPERTLKDIYIYNNQCQIAAGAIYMTATIHGYPGSTAETFAAANGCTFVPLTDVPAHEHESMPVSGTAPTCTEAGLTDGARCSICGYWIKKQKPIKPLGHDYQLAQTVLPTATENGFNRYQCSRCVAAYTEVIPVSTHEHAYSVLDSHAATCLEDGFTTYVCYGCGHSYTDIVPAPGHTFGAWKTFLPTEAGMKGIDMRFCSVCGVYELRESEATGTDTGTETPTDPAHTHTFTLVDSKDPTCELAGYKRYICTCGETKADILDPLAHNYLTGATVAATCTETGYTQLVCARCGSTKKTNLVPALGHAAPDDNGNCPRCGAHVQDVEPTPDPMHGLFKFNFFERIMEWFRNLFARLFG